MADSLKASQQGLKIIDQARRNKGWIKDAPAWQAEALKLTKENVGRSTLQRFWKQTPIRQALFVAICKAVGIEDWESIVDLPSTSSSPPNFSVYKSETWVGRSQLIDELLPKLQDKTRAVWITGIPGIGKTTLGECLASRAWDSNPSFQWIYLEVLEGQGAEFTTIAAELLGKLGETNLDPQERNDPKRLTDRLIRKLQANAYWLQLDSLERLLNPDQGTEFLDSCWVTFLQRCLTEADFASRLVLTAQALPSALFEFCDRYSNFWQARTLSGLSVDDQRNEHLDFFDKHGVAVDGLNRETLCKLGQVYEGHTLVLQVMSGEIQADFNGDVLGYWSVNQSEFEQVTRSLDSKRLNETEYNDELDRRVRDRVKKSLQQLPTDAQDLLLRSSVYRRPVPKKFWLSMIDDRSSSQQKEAYRVLCDRALVEKEGANIRQHNLIRSISNDLMKINCANWKAAQQKAAHLWLTIYEVAPDAPNIETIRGYLEAFDHYCEVEDWYVAKTILMTELDTPTRNKVHQQLGVWGYCREQIPLCQKILGKLDACSDGVWLNTLCSVYEALGDYQRTIYFAQQCLTISQKIGDRWSEGNALGNLGLAYDGLGQYERAIDCHQQALALAIEISDRRGEGSALSNLGLAYDSLGQYDRAIDGHQQYLMITREIGDRWGEGKALGNLGVAHHSLGQYEQAIHFLQQTLVISREIGDRRSEGSALGNLGLAYNRLGQHGRAIDCHQQALVISRGIGDCRGESCDLGNLGNAYNRLGQYEQAIDYHQQALVISREIGDRLGEGCDLGDLGNAYNRLGQYEQAIDYHQQALTITREIGDRLGESNALCNLGSTQLRLEQYPESLTNIQAALEIFQEICGRDGEAEALKNLAELHQALGEVKVAQQYCQEALELAIELGIPLAEECRKLQEEIEASLSIASG